MILVPTNISQVPLTIDATNSTSPVPPFNCTFQVISAVEPFKSGDETSVNAAPLTSQVE